MRLFSILLFLIGCVPAMAATTLPDFDLEVMNGDPGQLYSSVNDKPLLIEFYFNGCSACNANAAAVKEISDEFNNEATHVIEFSYDCDQSDFDSWIRRHSPSSFVIRGCESPVFDALNIQSFPTTIIFDANHNSIYRHVGTWNQRTKATIRDKMLELSQ